MNKIKDIVKEAGAILTIAALTVATTGVRVFAVGGEDPDEPSGTSPTSRASTGVDHIKPEGTEMNLENMVSRILNVVFGVVGIVAVIMIIIGGVNYTMSQGDTQKIQKAKNTIMYGIIGLVIVLLAFAIVNFVLTGLSGQ